MVDDLVRSLRDKNLIKKGRSNSFQVYVRVGGKYQKLGQPTTRDNALDLGSRFVDINPSAVFKIVKSNEVPRMNRGIEFGFFEYNIDKFRASRIKNNNEQKFTEKENYRIDSEVEKRGISFKGIRRRRVKKVLDLR